MPPWVSHRVYSFLSVFHSWDICNGSPLVAFWRSCADSHRIETQVSLDMHSLILLHDKWGLLITSTMGPHDMACSAHAGWVWCVRTGYGIFQHPRTVVQTPRPLWLACGVPGRYIDGVGTINQSQRLGVAVARRSLCLRPGRSTGMQVDAIVPWCSAATRFPAELAVIRINVRFVSLCLLSKQCT